MLIVEEGAMGNAVDVAAIRRKFLSMVSSSNRPPTTRGQRVDQHKILRLPATASVNLYGIWEAVVGSPSINAMKCASEKTNLLSGRNGGQGAKTLV